MINRDEKIENEIIKPKDKLIDELYQDNLLLHRELSRPALVIDEAEKYQNERDKILADNEDLHNKVSAMEIEYQNKSKNLDLELKCRKQELDMLIRDFEQETMTFVDSEKQLANEQRAKEWDLEF